MEDLANGLLELVNGAPPSWHAQANSNGRPDLSRRSSARDADFLRRCAWEIGEQRASESFQPDANHAALAMGLVDAGPQRAVIVALAGNAGSQANRLD